MLPSLRVMLEHHSKTSIHTCALSMVPLGYTEGFVTQTYDKLSLCSSFPGGQFVAMDWETVGVRVGAQ